MTPLRHTTLELVPSTGRYRIDRLIGEGGMALVYAGWCPPREELVAIKVLRPQFAGQPEAVERFTREATATARIANPHVIEVYDFGVDDDRTAFVVMELLDGETLEATLRREGCLPWPRAVRIVRQLCDALAAAHAAGIVHRDVTLANCFCVRREDDEDFIKLMDFGIARLASAEYESQRLTTEADVFGTPSFIAPEQAAHAMDADARSDVYAAGIVLYALLTGRLPFQARSVLDLLQQQMSAPPPPPRGIRPDIPAALEAVVLRALEKDPARRPQSMLAFAAALDEAARASVPRTMAPAFKGLRFGPPEAVLLIAGILASVSLWLAFA